VTDALLEVLVVEDEEMLREQVARLLPMLGYRVRVAADATAALAELDHSLPDIILTDLMLPDRPGYSVLEQSQRRQPGLPVLVMTAYASLESAIEALKQGAYDYLLKPIMPAELSAALSRAAVAVALHRSREHAEHLRHIAEVALTLAHEINNPLAVIMGELELQREAVGPDVRHDLEICLESARRIADVIRRIMALQDVVYQDYHGMRLLDLQVNQPAPDD